MVLNNGLTIIYGVIYNIPTNQGVTAITSIPMEHYAHLYCTPVWTGAYWNHGAATWVNNTTIQIVNYRSAGNNAPACTFYWLCFC